MLIRQIDDAKLMRLKARARQQRTSAEALGREAIHKAADELSVEEKQAMVREMQARFRSAVNPEVEQTPGIDLIREGRAR